MGLQVLFYAQLRDNNQGIVKITSGGLNKSPIEAEPVIEKVRAACRALRAS